MFGSRPRRVAALAGAYTHRLDHVDPYHAFTVCGIVAEASNHRLRPLPPSAVDCPYCLAEESFPVLPTAPR